MKASARPTVIVLGDEPRKVITIARSLHRQGVRVIVAAWNGDRQRVTSRAIADVVHLGGTPAESAQLLRMLVESEHAAWIVPTDDISLVVLAAGYSELSQLCAVGCPPPPVAERVLDKSITLAAAIRCGVPVPTSMMIPTASDLEAVISRLSFPIIAKPADKGVAACHGFKIHTFADADELRAPFTRQSCFGEGLLFQTYHGGQGVGIELLLIDGYAVASFQHRRLSENPPGGGVSVVAEAELVDPILLDYSVRLLRELEWEGPAMVEFRHDRATGATALMEVNGRFWGSLPLAVTAGVDFPFYAWQASQGIMPVVPSSYRYGLRVRWTAGALKRFAYAFEPGSDRIPKTAATRQLLLDFRPGTRSAMWSWDDPAPAVREVIEVIGGWLKEGIKRVFRAITPVQVLSVAKSARTLPSGRRGIYLRRRAAQLVGFQREVKLPQVVDSVVFVCHGNIMRSASAAQFLREDLALAGITDIRVSSAGTHARDGRAADPRVVHSAAELGVALDDHRATLLNADIVASNDVIFAMDEFNFANILTTFPESRHKLFLLGGINPSGIYHPHEIADPYMTGQAEVTETIGMVRGYAAALAGALATRRRAPATADETPAESLSR